MVFMVGCGRTALTNEPIRYTVLNDQRSICIPDTITRLPKHCERDSLIGRIEFEYCEGHHVLTGWTDDHYAATDGGSFWLELDSIGRIFGCSTTWPGFETVHSNSDSLNALITMALAAANRPGHFGIQYPLPLPPSIETVQFIASDSVP